ncbi:MAG: HEAT repeat domain-containing protein [Planctomycetes bacterium]|nr:HEAT repeat domain-containing protein [Planctomycetota bacterium]
MRAPLLLALSLVLLSSAVGLGQEPTVDEFDRLGRKSAIRRLKRLAVSGPGADRALRLIVDALDFPDVEVREQALTTIRELGPRAAIATSALIKLLDAQTEEEQRRATAAIARIGPGANAAGEHVLRLAEDESRELYTRQAAVRALGALERSPELDQGLLRIYADTSSGPHTRARALEAFGQGEGADPAHVVPALIRALSDRSSDVREAATEALSAHGPAAAPAAPALAEALSDSNRHVGGGACWALSAIGEPALPVLVGPVLSESEQESKLAAKALERIGESLEINDRVCLWVIPRVFLRHLITLAVLLLVWVAAARRFPKRAPTSKALRAIQIAIVVGIPVVVTGLAVYYATTLSWSSYYLPKPPVALVSPATATTLSCMFLVALPGVWACIRRSERAASPGA